MWVSIDRQSTSNESFFKNIIRSLTLNDASRPVQFSASRCHSMRPLKMTCKKDTYTHVRVLKLNQTFDLFLEWWLKRCYYLFINSVCIYRQIDEHLISFRCLSNVVVDMRRVDATTIHMTSCLVIEYRCYHLVTMTFCDTQYRCSHWFDRNASVNSSKYYISAMRRQMNVRLRLLRVYNRLEIYYWNEWIMLSNLQMNDANIVDESRAVVDIATHTLMQL